MKRAYLLTEAQARALRGAAIQHVEEMLDISDRERNLVLRGASELLRPLSAVVPQAEHEYHRRYTDTAK
jgi:hypothetical protein